MDVGTIIAATGLIGGAVGFIFRGVFYAGQKDSGISLQVKGHGEKLEEHGKRLDGHDERFGKLNTEFVPRPEVERALMSIEKTQSESKQLLLHLVTKRAIGAEVDLN